MYPYRNIYDNMIHFFLNRKVRLQLSRCFQKIFHIKLFITFRKHPQRNCRVYKISWENINPMV